MIDSQVFESLRSLANHHDLVRTYPGADSRSIFRSIGKLPGGIDQHLLQFFQETNGASLLDYCVFGCRNRSLPDIKEKTMELWPINEWLAGEIIPFVSTSIGELFGYLYHVDGSDGGHPVVYMENYRDEMAVPVSSSIGIFLSVLVNEVESALNREPSAVDVDIASWPSIVPRLTTADPVLDDLYSSGVFDKILRGFPSS